MAKKNKDHTYGPRGLFTRPRHVRWNWEQSPERNPDSEPFVRYHFVVVDDRNREGIMNAAIAELSVYGELIPLRSVEGKVSDTRVRYLFQSYDSSIKPDMLKLHELGKVLIMDPDLRERKRGNIEDYVARVYSK